MNYIQRAQDLKEETVAHRRYFHTNAEVGLETPKAVDYVMEQLKKSGLSPERCGHGVTAAIGTGGKTLLLRADMDALPMGEESGEPFCLPHRNRSPCLRPRFPCRHAADCRENPEGK